MEVFSFFFKNETLYHPYLWILLPLNYWINKMNLLHIIYIDMIGTESGFHLYVKSYVSLTK